MSSRIRYPNGWYKTTGTDGEAGIVIHVSNATENQLYTNWFNHRGDWVRPPPQHEQDYTTNQGNVRADMVPITEGEALALRALMRLTG